MPGEGLSLWLSAACKARLAAWQSQIRGRWAMRFALDFCLCDVGSFRIALLAGRWVLGFEF
ncbi:MAG: hypothetical protein RLZZ618_3727 [Pseudomonadota bacterium]|jgi:hypothetical protein